MRLQKELGVRILLGSNSVQNSKIFLTEISKMGYFNQQGGENELEIEDIGDDYYLMDQKPLLAGYK